LSPFEAGGSRLFWRKKPTDGEKNDLQEQIKLVKFYYLLTESQANKEVKL
jgi:hypothetical protein